VIKTRVARLVLALAILPAVTAACSSGSTKSTTATTPAATNTVVMKLIALKPEKLTIKAGESVTWKQTDAGFHTVTSGTSEQSGGGVNTKPDGRFDSGQLGTGKTFEHTFADPGSYPYFCSIHPATMRGEITVQ
jgi:plastocyanin